MLPSNSVVKKTALTAMRGKWLNLSLAGVALCFIFVIGAMLFAVLEGLLGGVFSVAFLICYSLFISLPTLFGAFRFYKRAMWGESDSPTEIFVAFCDKDFYIRYFSLGVYLFVRIGVVLLLFLIPAAIAKLFSVAEFYSRINLAMPSFAPSLSVVSTVLVAVGCCLAVIVNLKFYLMPFIMVSNDTFTVFEAEKLSLTMYKASVHDFFWLVLSMAGWIVLSLLVLPLCFTVPYFFSCYTVHCRFCMAKYNAAVTAPENTAPSFNPKF